MCGHTGLHREATVCPPLVTPSSIYFREKVRATQRRIILGCNLECGGRQKYLHNSAAGGRWLAGLYELRRQVALVVV
jgi:hypothetical protein